MMGRVAPSSLLFEGDTVLREDGTAGTVTLTTALYAWVEWDDGQQEERDRLAPELLREPYVPLPDWWTVL